MGNSANASSAAKSAAVRVSIVDHTRLYREGLAQILTREPGMHVVSTAADLEEASIRFKSPPPDVVLFHMRLPESLNVLRTVALAAPAAKIVAIGIAETEEEVIACAEAGAAGYLSREGSYEDLMSTIRSVMEGETRCSPRIAATLLKRLATLALGQRSRGTTVHLTLREWQIIRLVDRGLANKEIARHLSINVRTVKNHVHNILEKLQVHRRGEAAALVREIRSPLREAVRLPFP